MSGKSLVRLSRASGASSLALPREEEQGSRPVSARSDTWRGPEMAGEGGGRRPMSPGEARQVRVATSGRLDLKEMGGLVDFEDFKFTSIYLYII